MLKRKQERIKYAETIMSETLQISSVAPRKLMFK